MGNSCDSCYSRSHYKHVDVSGLNDISDTDADESDLEMGNTIYDDLAALSDSDDEDEPTPAEPAILPVHKAHEPDVLEPYEPNQQDEPDEQDEQDEQDEVYVNSDDDMTLHERLIFDIV